jgi:ribosomal-protein-alanine N-acetyltransferase
MERCSPLIFHIRLASISDLSEICSIEHDSFAEPYPRDLIAKLLEYNPSTFLAVVDEWGKLLGYCVASANGRSGHLISVAVERKSRRRGAATTILGELFSRLLRLGVKDVWLEVNAHDTGAIALYLKLGFEKLVTVDNYYSDGSPAAKMRLNLSPRPGVVHQK